jgi:transcriptional regulator with XRE-family HTH domain
MSDTESVKLIKKLKTWCDAQRGRRSEMARRLDVPRQRLTDWTSGRKLPTLEQGLQIAEFLRRSKAPQYETRNLKLKEQGNPS